MYVHECVYGVVICDSLCAMCTVSECDDNGVILVLVGMVAAASATCVSFWGLLLRRKDCSLLTLPVVGAPWTP